MKLHFIFTFILSTLFVLTSHAETFTLKGTVVDDAGQGISNIIASTTLQPAGAITNAKGDFYIRSVQANDTLVLNTFQGKFQVPLNGIKHLKITIGKEITAEAIVDETVNIGYGEIKKDDATMNTNTITGEKLIATGESTVDEALLKIMPSIRRGRGGMLIIRATQSFHSQGSPLYIVNGVPTGGVNNISLTEIKDVQVLKDGSACAIYGSRGNNGVILINLK